jgi:hypothetical protein
MKLQDLRIGNYIVYEATTHIVSAIGRSGVYSWWVKDGEPVIEYCLKDAGGVQVEDPYFDQISNYEPMPITEEWLLKFGFTYNGWNYDLGRFTFHAQGKDENGSFYNTEFYITRNSAKTLLLLSYQIEYVHQLQNIYFALTGEELTIRE